MTDDRSAATQTPAPAPGDSGDPVARAKALRRTRILAIALLILLALGATRTVISRMSNKQALEEGTAERAKVYVKVASPKSGVAGQTLSLPGTLQGYVQSPIAARASGYLRRWYKDIGSRVEKGELLAEIETPEIDQQLSQAIAARQQTAASLALAKSTTERWEALRKRDVVSQQELDEKRSAAAQANANLAAADANVERLRQMQGFTRVTAPFSGVITRRAVDTGDLIDSGGKTLFVLTQMDPLRIYVSVPQAYAQLVRPGQKVVVTQAELRGKSFEGEVVRSAGSIDTATRTMQVEIKLANRDGALMPGAYVQVALPLVGGGGLVVPTNVLLFRSEGTRVAVVDAANKVKLRPVTLGRNLGEAIEIVEGIGPRDRLVVNPSDSLADGDAVAVNAAADDAAAAGGRASGAARPAAKALP